MQTRNSTCASGFLNGVSRAERPLGSAAPQNQTTTTTTFVWEPQFEKQRNMRQLEPPAARCSEPLPPLEDSIGCRLVSPLTSSKLATCNQLAGWLATDYNR